MKNKEKMIFVLEHFFDNKKTNKIVQLTKLKFPQFNTLPV